MKLGGHIGHEIKKQIRKHLIIKPLTHSIGLASGGALGGGYGGGDTIPLLGEAGEYMLRKEVVARVGMNALDHFNATGSFPSGNSAGSGNTYIDQVVLPAVPGSSGIDPTVAAVKFARAISKRGL
jgi:hypothetical protein